MNETTCDMCGKESKELVYASKYLEQDTDDDGCFGMICSDCHNKIKKQNALMEAHIDNEIEIAIDKSRGLF